jgi:acetyl-CoA C-acetyltransferase
MGQVIQAGQGQITARQAAVKGGIPMTVHATTINKVCLSGLQTIYLADLMIRADEADIIIAGGMESMTNAPYLLPGARAGYRIGDQKVVDSMMFDGLTCAFDQCAMGLSTERYNAGRISRERQDEFSARSHQLAAAAIASGKVRRGDRRRRGPQRKGDPLIVTTDEGVRADTTVESLSLCAGPSKRMAPSRRATPHRSPTAGRPCWSCPRSVPNSWVSEPLGELVSYGQVAGPDASLLPNPRAPSCRPRRRPARRQGSGPVRDQRSVRRRRPGVGRRSRTSTKTRSTSTVARSPSVTRWACRARASR